MRKVILFLSLMLAGCGDKSGIQIANFTLEDSANKVVVLLGKNKIPAMINKEKDGYIVSVDHSLESKARALLTRYNYYFRSTDLNDLLESKFASLSKLETVKGNLLESREIYNKLSVIPDVTKAQVIVTGDKQKRISVLIMSLVDISFESKKNIESFLKGLLSEQDKLTVSYVVEGVHLE